MGGTAGIVRAMGRGAKRRRMNPASPALRKRLTPYAARAP
jgi:hypothetical protein